VAGQTTYVTGSGPRAHKRRPMILMVFIYEIWTCYETPERKKGGDEENKKAPVLYQ
jgi:hypothetical protein